MGTNILTTLQKREYFQTLHTDELVSLLLHASSLHPSLPLFTPKTGTEPLALAEGEEEFYEDEDVLPYPKAGNGVRLPPEQDDLSILLDDDTGTFSHVWEGIPEMMASASGGFLGIRSGGISVGA